MNTLLDWLNQEFLWNPLRDWLLFVGILIAGFFVKRFLSVNISRQLFRLIKENAETVPITEFVALLRKPFEALFMLCVLYLAVDRIQIPAAWNWAPVERFGLRMIADRVFDISMISAIGWIIIRFVKFIGLVFLKRAEKTESKIDDQFVPFFRDLAIVIIVILAVFAILDNVFNVDIVALITGLGIGGLALALAARETLENLFASFTIFLDLPFLVGDTVQVGAMSGDVEKVGFRSTRIRTADGSLITVPNRVMISQGLENLSQREYRRAKYVLHLTYATTSEQLNQIITEIKALIDTHELTNIKEGLVKFDGFGESSLDIQVIYHVQTADWRIFNNIKEEINFKILEIVEQNHAAFAYPTRKVLIEEETALKPQKKK
ncbi:MAG: mechanosensitive ion channel family protein [Spirosomataceae bacterium]